MPLTSPLTSAPNMLVAKRGDDVAFVAADGGNGYGGNVWSKRVDGDQLTWYVTDDRKLYKPGEDVHLKGWLREVGMGKGGDIGGLAGMVDGVTYTVMDSRGNQIGSGSAAVSAVGGFDTKFTLPKTPNLGAASVRFSAFGRTSGDFYHPFQIEEFRRPEFSVSAQASDGPFLVGSGGDVTLSAKYYSGGPLPGAPVTWNVSTSQTSFTPPNRDDYVFGAWVPWWGYSDYDQPGYQARRGDQDADRQDRRDRRAHAASRLLVGEPGDADVGDRERVRDRRESAGRGRRAPR